MANQPLDEKQLQALLRLKRHEQPPPGYYDRLLENIHRRQREELLRRPAWRIALERVKTLFQSLRVDWAYTTAMVGILLTGIAAVRLALPDKKPAPIIAAQPVAAAIAEAQPVVLSMEQNTARKLLPPLERAPAQPRGSAQPRQFAGGALPASYEANRIHF